jgi:hypothetical protein
MFLLIKKNSKSYSIKYANDDDPNQLSMKEVIKTIPKSCKILELYIHTKGLILPDHITHLFILHNDANIKYLPSQLKVLKFLGINLPEKLLPKSFRNLKYFKEFSAADDCFFSNLPVFPKSTKIIDVSVLNSDWNKKIILKLPTEIEQYSIISDGGSMQFPDLSKCPKLKVLYLSHSNIIKFPKKIINKKLNVKFEISENVPEIWKIQAKRFKYKPMNGYKFK